MSSVSFVSVCVVVVREYLIVVVPSHFNTFLMGCPFPFTCVQLLFLSVIVVSLTALTSGQTLYSCNGQLYSYPYGGCSYNNFNSNNNGALPQFYSCNGLLYTFPFSGCTYSNTAVTTTTAASVGTAVVGTVVGT